MLAGVATVTLGESPHAASQVTAAGDISTDGSCSPVIVGGDGSFQITCIGVPQAVVDALVQQLNDANVQVAAAQKMANDFAERYFVVAAKYEALLLTAGEGEVVGAADAISAGDVDLAAKELDATEEKLRLSQAEFKASAVQLLHTMQTNGVKFGGILSRGVTWASGATIPICFMDGDPDDRVEVAKFASEWTLYGNLSFDFGSLPSLRTCDGETNVPVRISFTQHGVWSYMGTEARHISPDKPTMNLEIKSMSPVRRKVAVLHEFGHVIGLKHMLQHPEGCQKEFDWEYIYSRFSEFGWTKEQIEKNFGPIKVTASSMIGDFDAASVMMYHLDAQYFLKGAASKCYSPEPIGLSALDKLAMYSAYPLTIVAGTASNP